MVTFTSLAIKFIVVVFPGFESEGHLRYLAILTHFLSGKLELFRRFLGLLSKLLFKGLPAGLRLNFEVIDLLVGAFTVRLHERKLLLPMALRFFK